MAFSKALCQQLLAKQLRDIIKNTLESLCWWHAEKQSTILVVQALAHTQLSTTLNRAWTWWALSPLGHLHLPHIFCPDGVQCQPPAGRTVNIHHWEFLPQHHKANKKRIRDVLIPVPGKRLYFKTKCWFWALCVLKDEDRWKLSLLGSL